MYLKTSTINQKVPTKNSHLMRAYQGAAPGFCQAGGRNRITPLAAWRKWSLLRAPLRISWERIPLNGGGYLSLRRGDRYPVKETACGSFLKNTHKTKAKEQVSLETSAIVISRQKGDWYIYRYLPHRRILSTSHSFPFQQLILSRINSLVGVPVF